MNSNFDKLLLIGISKIDNSIVRNRTREAGAMIMTNYNSGNNMVFAAPHKAKEALNRLFPYHQLIRIDGKETTFYFDNGTERISIGAELYYELENNLNYLQCIAK
jgi:hypothetical protein